MKLSFASVVTAFQLGTAHTVFTTLFVNDVDQGDGACVRMPLTANNATYPVVGAPLSVDTACGNGGIAYVNRTCPVPAGAKLTFTFRETPNNATGGALDSAHLGPCAVYMKNVSSPMDPGNGDSWFKIWDEGYDSTASKWCTEQRIMDTNGLLSVKIPGGLPGGYYLVRPELIALHNADKTPPDPQFYTGCAQVFLAPSDNEPNGLLPANRVSIPGWLSASDPGLTYNIYTMNGTYQLPGPMPYIGGHNKTVLAPNVLPQEYGLVPPQAVAANANWWASELDSYSTSDGCWNASASCFSQLTTCYNTAPPTGDTGCRLWEQRCDDIQSACNASNFIGPPNAGKNLTIVPSNPYPIPDAVSWNPDQAYSGQYNSSPVSSEVISITIIPTTPQATQRSISSSDTHSSAATRLKIPISSQRLRSSLTSRILHFLETTLQKFGLVERVDGAPVKVQPTASVVSNLTITIMNNVSNSAIESTASSNFLSSFTPWYSSKVLTAPSTPLAITHVDTAQTAQTIPTLALSQSEALIPTSVMASATTSVGHMTSMSTVTSTILVTVYSTWTSWNTPSASGTLPGAVLPSTASTDGASLVPTKSAKSKPISSTKSSIMLQTVTVQMVAASSTSTSNSFIGHVPLITNPTTVQITPSTSPATNTTNVGTSALHSAILTSNPSSVSSTSTSSSATSKTKTASSSADTDAITITIVPGTDHKLDLVSSGSKASPIPKSARSGAKRRVEYLKQPLPTLQDIKRYLSRRKRGKKNWE